jgi:uncharacterized protein (TIGR02722 family)
MRIKLKTLLIPLVSANLLVACATTGKVAYVDPNAVNTLTTNFTQNDLRLTAQDMATSLIQSGKINQCKTFTISPVRNETDQYVDTSVMSNAMTDKLTNSSAVKSTYVLSSDDMGNQVDELQRQNQSGLYDRSSTAKMGRMKGAECRIDGKLTSDTSVAPDGKTMLVSYTFFVQLFNVQQGTALWRRNKSISKSLTY